MVTPAVPADLKGASAAVAPLEFEIFRSDRDEFGSVVSLYDPLLSSLFNNRKLRQTSGDETMLQLVGYRKRLDGSVSF